MSGASAGSILALVALAGLSGCSVAPSLEPLSRARISEVYFAPPPEEGETEFIEILNRGSMPLDISGWSVPGVGPARFSEGAVLLPGEVAVLCKDREFCGGLVPHDIPVVAEYPGSLRPRGETLRLLDREGNVVDQVTYDVRNFEAQKAREDGLSLHRARFAAADGPAAWRAGPPSPGRSHVARSSW